MRRVCRAIRDGADDGQKIWVFRNTREVLFTVGNVYNPYGTVSLGEGGGFVRDKKIDLIWNGIEALILLY